MAHRRRGHSTPLSIKRSFDRGLPLAWVEMKRSAITFHASSDRSFGMAITKFFPQIGFKLYKILSLGMWDFGLPRLSAGDEPSAKYLS